MIICFWELTFSDLSWSWVNGSVKGETPAKGPHIFYLYGHPGSRTWVLPYTSKKTKYFLPGCESQVDSGKEDPKSPWLKAMKTDSLRSLRSRGDDVGSVPLFSSLTGLIMISAYHIMIMINIVSGHDRALDLLHSWWEERGISLLPCVRKSKV